MNKLPKARNENIIMQNLENEVLIYDTITDNAYCLNETCGAVFNACDGKQSFDDLKRNYRFTDDLIFLALDELKNKNLLADDKSYQSPFAGMSRREAVRRVGLGTMIALPVVAAMIAPNAANAASAACPPLSPVAACTPNAAGCFGSGANTAVCGGGTTGRSCAQACAPFAPRCCSCTVEFAIDRRPDSADCFCACQ